MITLIAISGLGIICLLLEILNMRKILVPIILLGLAGILGMTIFEFCKEESLISSDMYGMIRCTDYSRAFSILFIILAALVIAMSPRFYENNIVKIADYVSLKVFLLAGAVAMVSFGNFAMFFIGLEVLSIAGYVLASSNPKSLSSNEAGMKYFIMGAFASSFILFGIALVYGATGSFDMGEIMSSVSAQGENIPIWFGIGFIMIVVGLLFKASLAPFHFWAPDVYEGSPTLVTALMSTLVKVAAIAALYKVATMLSAGVTPAFQTIIIAVSILSMTMGNVTALKQKNIKRLMAYSGVSHAGFMVMTLVALGTSATTVIYYASAYSLAGIAAFAVILAVCRGKGNEDITHFHGLGKRQPLLAAILAGSLMSLGGIPVFAGFFAKFFVFTQMLQVDYLLLVIVGIINSGIAVFYYYGVINVMYTKESVITEKTKTPAEYMAVGVIAIGLNILLGVFPSIVMGLELL